MNKIIDELIMLKDEKYKEFNKKLCPDTNLEMLGISPICCAAATSR